MTTLQNIPDLYIISPVQTSRKHGSFLSISQKHIIPNTGTGVTDIAKNFDTYLYE